MPKLSDLKVVIGLSGLRSLNKDLKNVQGKFRKNFGAIAGMAKNAALAVSGSLIAGLGILIKKGAEMETLRTGFISIAGGANKAAAIVKELNDFTARTPFQLQEVSSAARQLLAVGTTRSQLQDRLKMLGDIAASSGNSINDIAAIFSKVKAKGKVELENLNQLAERGIPIFDELRKATGDANMEFGAGAVSVEDFNKALENMTAEGGLAAGAMENLSETVEGRITTLMDNLGLELGKAAERSGVSAAFSGILKDATESLQGISGVAQSDVAAALGIAEEAMEGFGNVSQANLSEVEDKSAQAQAALKDLEDQIKSSAKRSVGVATLFGGKSGGLEAAKDLANMLKPLQAMMEELGKASLDVNQAVLAGTLAATSGPTGGTGGNGSGDADDLDTKEKLFEVEKSRLLQMGMAKELQGTMASDILASAEANHTLKGSFDELGKAVQLPMDRMVELSKYAATQLPGFFEGAFEAIADSTQSFGEYIMQVLERLIKKAAALAATFAIISIFTGGAGGAALGGFGEFMKGGFGLGGIPQMASGGLFTGASLAMVGEGSGTSLSNPEVVAPLDKLQQMMGGGNVTVTGMIRGSDILLSNERSALDRNRVRGF